MSEYGAFSPSGDEFIITQRDIPRHWNNYLWNSKYITMVSQVGTGEGFIQDHMGRRILLVCGRNLFLSDGENKWSAMGFPVDEEAEEYSCTHGIGYTSISLKKYGIQSSYTVFVPDELEGEAVIITLTNAAKEKKNISAVSYFNTAADGPYLPQGYNTCRAEFNENDNAIYTFWNGRFNGGYCNRTAVFASDNKITAYDTAHNAFVGKYSSEQEPKSIKNGKLTNSNAFAEKICYALENKIELYPGESKTVVIMLAMADTEEAALRLKEQYCNAEAAFSRLKKVKERYLHETDGVFINTPDEKLNCLFNYWLKYETDMGSRWARVRHNGYRDMMSDTDCLAVFNPELAKERMKRILEYQYSSGYAPRTFINGTINDNNFADNCVWIAYTVNSVVKELGDISILDEAVAYNDGSEATVYDHVKAAIDFLWNFRGHHNLIRIWGGDWNDSINSAGLEGKGVSIWLSIAWCGANKKFAELARLKGCKSDAEQASEREKEMEQLIDRYGWNGSYYIYGYSDNGVEFGSDKNNEGRIHLIPQLWAVLAGIGTDEQRKSAINKVHEILDTELGTLALYPFYTHHDKNVGEMTAKPIGLFLNGGVYMHTMCWQLAVDCMMKDSKLAWRDLNLILPFRNGVVAGRAEPYVMCNSYLGKAAGYRYGTPGQSWRTAANGWMVKAVVRYIFGIKPEMDGIRIEPCIPEGWAEASVIKKFRSAVYSIRYINSGANIKSIIINNRKADSNILPYEDSAVYNVEVEMN